MRSGCTSTTSSNIVISRLESLIASYRELSATTLATIRHELRLRTLYHLDSIAQHPVSGLKTRYRSVLILSKDLYDLEEPTLDPDSFVVSLNADISQVDECLATTVGSWERK